MKLSHTAEAAVAAILWWLIIFRIVDSIIHWDYLIERPWGFAEFLMYILLFIIISIARYKLYKQHKEYENNSKD